MSTPVKTIASVQSIHNLDDNAIPIPVTLRYPKHWRVPTDEMHSPHSESISSRVFAWLTHLGITQGEEERHRAMSIAGYAGMSLPCADPVMLVLYAKLITLWLSWDDLLEGKIPKRFEETDPIVASRSLAAHLETIREIWSGRIPPGSVASVDGPISVASLPELYDAYAEAWRSIFYDIHAEAHVHRNLDHRDVDRWWSLFASTFRSWFTTALRERDLFSCIRKENDRAQALRSFDPVDEDAQVPVALRCGPRWNPHGTGTTTDDAIVKALLDQRAVTIGMFPTALFVALSVGWMPSPDAWIRSDHQTMLFHTGMLVGWQNDLFGSAKDLDADQDWGNVVLLKGTLHGDLERAFRESADAHNEHVRAFDDAARRLDWKENPYIDHLRYCVSGFGVWHSQAPRYASKVIALTDPSTGRNAVRILRPCLEFVE